jgi:hypothetical protein
MASIYRVKAIWSGFQGAPGYTTVYFQNVSGQSAMDAAQGELYAFFNACKAYFPNGCTINVQKQVDELDLSTGVLLGTQTSINTQTPVVGTAPVGAYAGGSGVCVTWTTALIFAGRRVKGRTFLVPATGCFDTDGTLNSTAMSVIGGAANTFATSPTQQASVWSKTWDNAKPPNQIGGAAAEFTGATVKDMASQLRTRRT